MIIDSIEYHEDLLPPNLDPNAVCPLFVVIMGWAYERDLLGGNFAEKSPFKEVYKRFSDGDIDACEFVSAALDGVILKEYFSTEAATFIESYLTTGDYYRDLANFFGTHFYALPAAWEECKKFFQRADIRYEEYQATKKSKKAQEMSCICHRA